jgi:hypothetical protein
MQTPLDIFKKTPHLTKTLSLARMTMWVFEVAGLLLIPVIIASSR